MEQDEIIIDGPLLSRAFRHQIRLWAFLGPPAFGALLLLALALIPRSYTAAVSVAMEQPAAPSGLQSLLGGGGGGGGGSKHYIGLLKSRDIALQVENRVHLQQVYGPETLPTAQAAAAVLMRGIKLDDDPDGLLYVSVTLPGPPRLSFHGSPRPAQVEQASAQAANAYALALKEYLLTSDTDQGSVLLRGADAEVRRARADYDDALGRVLEFNRDLGRVDPRNVPQSSGVAPAPAGSPGGRVDDATAASGLGGLYSSLFGVQGDLRAALAARQTTEQHTSTQLQDLPSVPTDDPLLAGARGRVAQDQAAYESASRLFGPENPTVIRAKTQLDVDQAQLDRQIQGVRQNLTTQNAQSDAQIQSLYAKQAALVEQIASSERHLGVSRQLSGELGRLQTELGFRTDILRATLTQAQTIKLNNVSAQSRMTIIDPALPPATGEPGATKLSLFCLLPVVLAFLAAVAWDYLRSARAGRGGAGPTPATPGANGSGAKAVPTDEAAAPLVRKRSP